LPNDVDIPISDNESFVLGFVKEAIEEGDSFLKAQFGYSKIDDTIKAIMGEDKDLKVAALSTTTSNRTGKIATDLVSLLTDIKPFWEYKTENSKYEQQQIILGKLSTGWYRRRSIDQRLAGAVRYCMAAATGPLQQFWNPLIGTEGDIDASEEDPRDVLPIRPAGFESYQNCAGVIIRREYPVNYLRRRYPSKASLIRADRDGSLLSTLRNTRVGQLLQRMGNSPFHDRLLGNEPARTIPRIPTADLFTVYLHDQSVNDKSYDVQMGEFWDDKTDPETYGKPKKNWSYIVKPGEPLYPRGRVVTCTRSAVLRDGPNIYWHGLFPVCKLTLDPWPWSFLGKSPLWDVLPLNRSLNQFLQIMDDHFAQVARPGVVADASSVSRAKLDRVDTRRAGYKIYDKGVGRGVQIQPPPSLPPDCLNQRDWLTNEMDLLSGARDMAQLMNLGQLPSAEAMEKLIYQMSASVRGRSRVLECFIREFAMMLAYNFAQFYPLQLRMSILGPMGATPEDFDQDPATLVPDFVHPEDFRRDGSGLPSIEALARGPLPRYDRAREFLRQFDYTVAPGSQLNASAMERKMMYLQLARAGWMDLWTLGEELGIPNYGKAPDDAPTVIERLQRMQDLGLGMQVSAAGRKASGQTSPRLTMKES